MPDLHQDDGGTLQQGADPGLAHGGRHPLRVDGLQVALHRAGRGGQLHGAHRLQGRGQRPPEGRPPVPGQPAGPPGGRRAEEGDQHRADDHAAGDRAGQRLRR